MSSLLDLATAIPARFVAVMIVGYILFILYLLIDLFFLVMRRHFGRINIDLVHFTRNDNSDLQSNELLFRTVEGPIFLKKEYNNHFLFWRVIFRSMRATFDDPVVTFGKQTYAALIPFRERVSSKCALGHFKRAFKDPFKKKKFWLVMVDEKLRSKRRNILKVLLIQEEDLKNIEEYRENPPSSTRNFEMFEKVARAFQKNPEAFLDVEVVVS